MIKELWVIDKQSGKILLQRSYREVMTSSRLVEGFLQAIYGLYQYAEAELVSKESGKGLESLNMVGMRWLYEEKKGVIFIAATDRETPIELLREQMSMIADTFIKKFGDPFEALYSGGVEKWLESDFSQFIPELDDLIMQWEKMRDVERSAKIMDFLEVIQNIVQRFQNFPGFNYLIEGGQLDILGSAFSDGNWDMSFLSTLDERELRSKIEQIFNTIMNYFRTQIPDVVTYLVMQHLVPYFKSDWNRIKESKLDELFIQIFF